MAILRITGCVSRPCVGRSRKGGPSSPVAAQHKPEEASVLDLQNLAEESVLDLQNLAEEESSLSSLTTESSVQPLPSKMAPGSWNVALSAVRVVLLARRTQRRMTDHSEVESVNREVTRRSSWISRSGSRKRTEADLQEAIQQMRKLLNPGEALGGLSSFAKAYGDEAFCRRLLRKTDGNVKKSTDKFRQALLWREKHKLLLTERKFALGSDERVIGSDFEGRPILFMCMKNQMLPGSKCLDQKVVTMLQAIERMPDGVEKTVHIWDLHGQQFRISDLNPAPLVSMLQSQETYFVERLHEIVIIGMPKVATVLKDAVWPVVPEKTRAKIRFVTAEQAKEHFDQNFPAEVAQRITESMKENRDANLCLEDRKKNWRRMNEHGELVPLTGNP